MNGLRLKAPDVETLEALRSEAASQSLTYAPSGVVEAGVTPPGFRRDRWFRMIGTGGVVFDAAAAALTEWEIQRRSGLIVHSDGPVAPGRIVAMAAPLPIGYVDVVCRVIELIDEPVRRGFVYGTLPRHPEMGEERFAVVISDDDAVTFEIEAVWRLRHPLARAVPVVARLLQRRATERYFEAMEAIVREGTGG